MHADRRGHLAERQAELSFKHAARLVALAGGTPEDICQIRAFVKEPDFKRFIDAQLRQIEDEGLDKEWPPLSEAVQEVT